MIGLFVISEPSTIGFVFSLVMFLILIITIGFTKAPQEIKQKLSLFLSVTVVMDRESMRSEYGTVFLSDGVCSARTGGWPPQSDMMAHLVANCLGGEETRGGE